MGHQHGDCLEQFSLSGNKLSIEVMIKILKKQRNLKTFSDTCYICKLKSVNKFEHKEKMSTLKTRKDVKIQEWVNPTGKRQVVNQDMASAKDFEQGMRNTTSLFWRTQKRESEEFLYISIFFFSQKEQTSANVPW